MPKSKDKKSKLKEPIPGGKNTKTRNDLKKRKTPQAGSFTGGIEMSKQLARKVTSRKRATSSKPNNVGPRICGNGKPMPSLAELEKMFEDSDDGDESTASMSTNYTERCKTPVYNIDTTHITDISPKTLKKLTSKIIDVVTTISDSLVSNNDPSPTIIHRKQSRKRGLPNITSCKDYTHSIKEPNISFFKAESDHAVDINDNCQVEEDDCLRKRRKISNCVINMKHDINVEKSNEFEIGEILSDGSTDSNKTVSYDFMNSSFNSEYQHRSFSPLPSTSKDNDTFLQNVKRFNDSLQFDKISTPESNDLEIIEIPCETVILDVDKNLNNCLEVIEIDVKEQNDGGQSPIKDDSPIVVDDYYSSIDLNQNYNSGVCETVDIDEVMAENKVIIEKYKNIGIINTVTQVKPNSICDKQLTRKLKMKPPHCSLLDCNSIDTVGVKEKFSATQVDVSKNKIDDNLELIDYSLASTTTQPSFNSRNKIEEIVTVFFGSQKDNTKVKQNCSSDKLNDGTSSDWNDTIKQWVTDIDHNAFVNSRKSKTTNRATNGKQHTSKADFNSIIDITSGYYTPTVQPVRQTNYNVILLDPSPEQTRESVSQCNDAPFLVDSFIIEENNGLAKRDNNIQIIDLDDGNNTTPVYYRNLTINNNGIQDTVEMIRNFSTLDHNYMTVNNDHVNADVIRNARLDHNYLTVTTDINQRNRKSKRNTKAKTNVQMSLEKSIENETPRSISDCPICMENMSSKEIASTMCGHLFCMKCIKAAIKASGKKCPTCRKALKGVGYHQIFL